MCFLLCAKSRGEFVSHNIRIWKTSSFPCFASCVEIVWSKSRDLWFRAFRLDFCTAHRERTAIVRSSVPSLSAWAKSQVATEKSTSRKAKRAEQWGFLLSEPWIGARGFFFPSDFPVFTDLDKTLVGNVYTTCIQRGHAKKNHTQYQVSNLCLFSQIWVATKSCWKRYLWIQYWSFFMSSIRFRPCVVLRIHAQDHATRSEA